MSNYPRYSLAGGNQYPAVSSAIPSQLPVIEIVDGAGEVITNLGNGAADGTWINMTLINGFTAGATVPQYMKDSRNVVHFRGLIVCPGGVTTAWSAPAGYVPVMVAGSSSYLETGAGGSDLVSPSRMSAVHASGDLAVGITSGYAAGAVATIAAIDRIIYQA